MTIKTRLARIALIPALVLLPACASGGLETAPAPSALSARAADVGAAAITPEGVRRQMNDLAGDAMRGRETPSPELERAAEYLAAEFRGLGLEPAGDSGTYIQRWPYRAIALDPARVKLELRRGGTTVQPSYGREYFVLPSSADSAVGEAVFLGTAAPGIREMPAETQGRIAVFYLQGAEPNSEWGGTLVQSAGSAARAGAAGVLFVLDPAFKEESVAMVSQGVSGPMAFPITIGAVRLDAVREAFNAAGVDLDAARQAEPGSAAQATSLGGMTVAMSARANSVESRPPNVVGLLRGSDPELRDTYVIFSAHMDHVGVGRPDAAGDSIYNGADDNASGTAALLQVARAFAALAQPPARSVVFLAVSGEEKGLLGSRYYSDNPTVPIERVVANINMDMVGRNSPDSVVAIGLDFSSLGPLVQEIAAKHPELGLTVAPDLWPEEQLFFRSDHFNFARKEIPAIFFTTGLHEDYHRPSDEPEKIDVDKIARISKLVFYLGYEIATRREPPQWTEDGLAQVRAMTR